jgi:hypothetical protein
MNFQTAVNDGGNGGAVRVMRDFNYNITQTDEFCRSQVERIMDFLISQQMTVKNQLLAIYNENWKGGAADQHQLNLLDWYYQGQLKLDRLQFLREQLLGLNEHAKEVLQMGMRLYIDPERSSAAVYVDGGHMGMNYTDDFESYNVINTVIESMEDALVALKKIYIPDESAVGWFSYKEDAAQNQLADLLTSLTTGIDELDTYRYKREAVMNAVYELENAIISRMELQPPLVPNLSKILETATPQMSMALMGKMTEELLQEEDEEAAKALIVQIEALEEELRKMIKAGDLDEDKYIGKYDTLKVPITYNGVFCYVVVPDKGAGGVQGFLWGIRKQHRTLMNGDYGLLYGMSDPEDGDVPTLSNVMTNRYRIAYERDLAALTWWNENKVDGASWDDFPGFEYAFEGKGIEDIEALLLAGGIEDYEKHKLYMGDDSKKNDPIYEGWGLVAVKEGSDGLVMELYKNSDGEIVVSVRANSNLMNRVPRQPISEYDEADKIAYEWMREYKNISFVGMDRGGAIAQLLAINYNQPATVFNSSLTAYQLNEVGLLPKAVANQLNSDDTKIKGYYVVDSVADALDTGTGISFDDQTVGLKGKPIWQGTLETVNPFDSPDGIASLVSEFGLGAAGVISELTAGETVLTALKSAGIPGFIIGTSVVGVVGVVGTFDENNKRAQTLEALMEYLGNIEPTKMLEYRDALNRYKKHEDE